MLFWLTSLAILVQFLGIVTAAAHRELRDTANEAGIGDVCLTKACNDTVTRLMMDMDITINPCDDFYQFTCGSFLKRDLPSGTVSTNYWTMARAQFKSQLRSLLEADYAAGEFRPLKLMRILYKTCMDETTIERKGVLPLKNLIRMIGGWPVLQGASWNESNFDWMATTAGWIRAGIPAVTFMKFHVEEDNENTAQKVLSVAPPTWIIRSYYLNQGFNRTAVIRAYYTLMVDVAVSLGADRKFAEYELKEALLFQIQLSNVIEAANHETLRLTLKTLIARYPTVNWRDTFARMYSPTQNIVDDDIILVYSPTFITGASALVSRTPKRILANFAMFQIISLCLRMVNNEMNEKLNAYMLVNKKYVKSDPRWLYCTNTVINHMPIGVTSMYVKELFKPEIKVQFEDMIQNIRQEFRANLDKVPFLDNASKAFAKKRESGIKIAVGHPNGLVDNAELDKYYANLDLFDDYLFNVFFLSKFDYDILVRQFRKPINYDNSTEVYHHLLTSIGHANPVSNRISFSPITLQVPLFSPEQPRYINFATCGMVIGHEITHLVYNDSKLHDGNAVKNGSKILTTPSEVHFQERVTCFKDQYGNYTEHTINRNVNGRLTLDENIADNAGVKHAYHAYVNTMSGKAPEKRLHGLNYTPKQMFWIAFGNIWCEKSMPFYLKSRWGKEKHAMSRFRVIGSVSNSEEFAKDFNCKLGSAMNPTKKCSIW